MDEGDAGLDAGLAHPVLGGVEHLGGEIDAGQPPPRFGPLEGDDLDPGAGTDDEQPRAGAEASLQEGERLAERAQVAGYHGAGEPLVGVAVGAIEVEGFRTHAHKRLGAPRSLKA